VSTVADTVFVGPTLTAGEVRALLPGAQVAPPVRHGDLLRLDPGPGDRVFIIDGLFLQTAPVRHREVLDLLARGVVVAGSSSMGALRAAELEPFGMRGVGRVFQLYREGTVTGDDEVAVLYGPAEDGYPQLSRPLVDVRCSLDRAVAGGVLTRGRADVLLRIARSLPFRDRGPAALRQRARATVPGEETERYLSWAEEHPVDVKADDARLLLRLAAAGSSRLSPAGPRDRTPVRLDTSYLDAWRARHRGLVLAGRLVPDAAVAAVIMAWHPDFPASHRRHVLEGLAGPGPDLERRALALARRRGLTLDGHGPAGSWLDPGERSLPPDEALLRLLVRAFGTGLYGTGLGRPALRAVPPRLLTSETVRAARRFARRAAEVNERLPRPDPHRPSRRVYFRAEVIDELFCTVWKCARNELTRHARDRGFSTLTKLRATAEPYVGIALATGESPFPPPSVGASPDE
jgi:hypothetical protein